MLTVVVASNLGALASFSVGRTVARRWVEAKIAASAKFKAMNEAVARQGFLIVLLTRLSPVFPFSLQNYAYGVTKVQWGRYVLASLIGMLPGTVMYVYLGSVVHDVEAVLSGEIGGGLALKAVGLIATVAVTVLITRIAKHALSEAASGSMHQEAVASRREKLND